MILLGADPLSRFLNRAAATPFEWGRHDCLLWLADWSLERRGGSDPAEGIRGVYSTMLGAARIVREAGGMRALMDYRARMAGASAVNVEACQRGDVAVVRIDGSGGELFNGEAGAILLGGSAALISQAGLIVPRLDDLPIVAAWRV